MRERGKSDQTVVGWNSSVPMVGLLRALRVSVYTRDGRVADRNATKGERPP
jgi:hypothetical protein